MELRRFLKSKTDGTNFLTLDESNTLCAYSFTVATPSTEWVVNHNNDSTILAVQVFVGGEVIEPDELIIDNGNTFRVQFSAEVAGFVNFILFKVGSAVCVEITPTPSVTVTPTPDVTPTMTATPGASATPTPTTTVTPTSSNIVASPTPTVTPTGTSGVTPTPAATITPTPTPTDAFGGGGEGGEGGEGGGEF